MPMGPLNGAAKRGCALNGFHVTLISVYINMCVNISYQMGSRPISLDIGQAKYKQDKYNVQ